MHFEFSVDYKDYRNAQRLYLQHRKLAAVYFYFWAWALPIASALFCLLSLASIHLHGEETRAMSGLFGAALWCAIAIPITRFFRRRRAWKQFLPPSLAKRGFKAIVPVVLELSDSQVALTQVGRCEERFYWNAITDYAEDERLALLFVSKKQFLFVPKRAMPEEGWQNLRRLITQRVVAA